jgi:hypothetical protein
VCLVAWVVFACSITFSPRTAEIIATDNAHQGGVIVWSLHDVWHLGVNAMGRVVKAGDSHKSVCVLTRWAEGGCISRFTSLTMGCDAAIGTGLDRVCTAG